MTRFDDLYEVIGAEYGINRGYVSKIKTGLVWSSLTGIEHD